MKKLTEIELLKYWLDAELSLLHLMFAAIMWKLTGGWLVHLVLGVYMFNSFMYTWVRIMYVTQQRPNFLKIPKK